MPTLNELLHAASRTFAVGIDLLPPPLRGEVEAAYLLLRVSDYLEDNESMEPVRKAALLELWARVLEGVEPVARIEADMGPVDEPTPDALVARNVAQVVGAYAAMRSDARAIVGRHVCASSRGMARWSLRGPDLADEADLDDYMHEVAGRVGWLLTELFALDVPAVAARRDEMMGLGREFGLGLQTVNVIRGLHSDRQRGWVYVPRSFGGERAPQEVFGDADAEARVLSMMVAKATRHLEAAERYIVLLPRRRHGIRLFCLLPYLFAVRTLALSRRGTEVFHGEVKIGRPEVARIARDARLLGWSNGWIRRYARRLAEV
jgi:farnesyl-diphosphate farnesyltransferase